MIFYINTLPAVHQHLYTIHQQFETKVPVLFLVTQIQILLLQLISKNILFRPRLTVVLLMGVLIIRISFTFLIF